MKRYRFTLYKCFELLNSMRYSKYLKSHLYEPFREEYLPYTKLKKILDGGSVQKDEFVKKMKKSVSSVLSFTDKQLIKLEKIVEQEEAENMKQARQDLKGLIMFIKANSKGFQSLIHTHNELYDNEKSLFHKYLERIDKWKRKTEVINKLCDKIDAINNNETKPKENNKIILKHNEKYWIPEKDTVFVRMGLTRNMKEGMGTFKEGEITTIYLDNAEFQEYTALLCRIENINAIKISWEGNSNIVRIEQQSNNKTASFYMNEKDVLEYMKGNDVFDKIKELNLNKADKEGIEELSKTYSEIQQIIKEKKLRPMLRTICKQLFISSNELEAVLESRIAMIRECSSYEASAGITPRQWRREDIEGSWPYGRVKMDDITRFPYSVLTISYNSMMPWLSDLLNDCGADRVDSFSKALHGVASLFKVAEPTPYWMARVIPDEPSSSLHSEINVAITPAQPIAIPVRVEPKVFFANERTFLSWVQFAIFLGGIGTAMLGLGDKHASFCGLLLIIVASIFSVYSLYLFHWRLRRIRERDPGPYDDRYGPTVLVCVFLLAIVLACIFKIPLKHGYRLN